MGFEERFKTRLRNGRTTVAVGLRDGNASNAESMDQRLMHSRFQIAELVISWCGVTDTVSVISQSVNQTDTMHNKHNNNTWIYIRGFVS